MVPNRQIHILALLAAVFAAASVFAADGSVTAQSAVDRWKTEPTTIFDATEISLDEFLWQARPVIVFADTPANPAFNRQVELLQARVEELVARDVVLIVDTSRSDPSDIRRKLRPRGFMLTLIGKDGGVKLRKPFPWDVRELSRSIDKIPLRQQEIRDSAHAAE